MNNNIKDLNFQTGSAGQENGIKIHPIENKSK